MKILWKFYVKNVLKYSNKVFALCHFAPLPVVSRETQSKTLCTSYKVRSQQEIIKSKMKADFRQAQ